MSAFTLLNDTVAVIFWLGLNKELYANTLKRMKYIDFSANRFFTNKLVRLLTLIKSANDIKDCVNKI